MTPRPQILKAPAASPMAQHIIDHFSGNIHSRTQIEGFDVPELAVFICFTNRCGSTYLASLIASSGKYNMAGEDFDHNRVISVSTSKSISSYEDYIFDTMQTNQKTGIFFSKISVDQLLFLESSGLLEELFPNKAFIHVDRIDKIGQSISYMIALQTNAWIRMPNDAAELGATEFNPRIVDEFINSIRHANERLSRFFATNDIQPISVVYEELLENPTTETTRVLQSCGLSGFEIFPERVPILMQRTPRNEEFRNMYMEYRAAPG